MSLRQERSNWCDALACKVTGRLWGYDLSTAWQGCVGPYDSDNVACRERHYIIFSKMDWAVFKLDRSHDLRLVFTYPSYINPSNFKTYSS